MRFTNYFLAFLIAFQPLFAGATSRTLSADFMEGGSKTDRNYIADGNFERNVNGVSGYADAAGTSPVDATAGSPTLTCTRTTSTPLRGDGSLLITKDAANRQGNGCSIPFTTDVADNTQVLTINFDYIVASGTYADNDLDVYIYDVTGSVLIQPAAYHILNSTLAQKWTGSFQVPSGSTSFRLAYHVASTSASAYTVKIDNVSVGPKLVTGVIPKVPTKQTFTSSSGTYTTPSGVQWIKVRMVGGGGGGSGGQGSTGTGGDGGAGGNSTFGTSLLTANGGAGGNHTTASSAGGTATVSAPATQLVALAGVSGQAGGVTLAGSQQQGGIGGVTHFGGAGIGTGTGAGTAATANTGSGGGGGLSQYATSGQSGTGGASGGYVEAIISNPSATYSYAVGAAGTAGTAGSGVSSSAGGAGGSGFIEVIEYYVGTNTVMSSDTATQVVAATYTTATAGSYAVNAILDFGTKVIDTTNSVTTGASWKFTAPVSGYYRVSAAAFTTTSLTSGQYMEISARKNGSVIYAGTRNTLTGTATNTSSAVSSIISMVAGDYIDIISTASNTVALLTNAAYNFVNIERISGPQQIAASESVSFRGRCTTNQVLTANSTNVTFDSTTWDSHVAYSAGLYTVPISGKYHVSVQLYDASTAVRADIYQNGSNSQFGTTPGTASVNSVTIRALAGDTISIRSGANATLSANGSANIVSIDRVGNY